MVLSIELGTGDTVLQRLVNRQLQEDTYNYCYDRGR